MENGRNCSLGAISPLIHNILLPDVRFYVQRRTRFSLRNKRLFEITEVEITRVDCIIGWFSLDFADSTVRVTDEDRVYDPCSSFACTVDSRYLEIEGTH